MKKNMSVVVWLLGGVVMGVVIGYFFHDLMGDGNVGSVVSSQTKQTNVTQSSSAKSGAVSAGVDIVPTDDRGSVSAGVDIIPSKSASQPVTKSKN